MARGRELIEQIFADFVKELGGEFFQINVFKN